MKKLITILLYSAIMFCSSVVLNAQDTTTIIKNNDTITTVTKYGSFIKIIPKSRVGGTIGLQIPEDNVLSNGIGLEVLFHQTISQHWFLSFDAGWHRNSMERVSYNYSYETMLDFEGAVTTIPISLGINAFLSTSGVRPYFGLGVGLLNEKLNLTAKIDDIKVTDMDSEWYFLLVPTFGVSIPITKKLCIAANFKFAICEVFYGGLNVGIAYQIP